MRLTTLPPLDSMPTSFVSSKLNIDPQMPFRGTQDLHARRQRKAALKVLFCFFITFEPRDE